MVTDYLPVEVTKREGILKQKIKSGKHVLIIHTQQKKKKKKRIARPSVVPFRSVSYVIKEETGKMQSKPWSHRRCQISHGFQQDQWLFNLFTYNPRNSYLKTAMQFLSELYIYHNCITYCRKPSVTGTLD